MVIFVFIIIICCCNAITLLITIINVVVINNISGITKYLYVHNIFIYKVLYLTFP